MRITDYIVKYLEKIHIRNVFALNGAYIEDLIFAFRDSSINVILGKQEFSAANMAQGSFFINNKPGVVLTTSGGGAFNLVPSLAEARSSQIPMLAIVGQLDSELEEMGYFQDLSGKNELMDIKQIFNSVALRVERVETASDLPRILDHLITQASRGKGPTVLLLPKSIQKEEIDIEIHLPEFYILSENIPTENDHKSWDDFLMHIDFNLPSLVVWGGEVNTLKHQNDIKEIIKQWPSYLAVTPSNKGLIDSNHPHFLGVTGAMGNPSVQKVANNIRQILVIGSELSLMDRNGLEEILKDKETITIHQSSSMSLRNLMKRTNGIDLKINLDFFIKQLKKLLLQGPIKTPYAFTNIPLSFLDVPKTNNSFLSYKEAFDELNQNIPPEAHVFADAGNLGAAAVHYLKLNGKVLFKIALGMGGMGYSFGAGIGASIESKQKTYVIAGDGAFFMCGLEIHTAIENKLSVCFIIFNNNAHAMCHLRDLIFLKEKTKLNCFKNSFLANGIKAMFPEISSYEVTNQEELKESLIQTRDFKKPSIISILLSSDELPPYKAFL